MSIKSFLFWMSKVNLLKTIYYSVKYGGKIIVGKASVKVRGGKISFMDKKSKLYIGINYSYPVPCVLDIYNGELSVDGVVNLNRGCKIRVYNGGILSIGNNSYVNEGTKIYCAKEIIIGSNCAISFDTKILDTNTHFIFRDGKLLNEDQSVNIGNNVWIGTNTIVLKGTTIENNVIVGASSLVKGMLRSNLEYAGVPAKPQKEFERWRYTRY